MGPISIRQFNQSGSVEIYPTVMDMVGILIRVHSAGPEPDLSLFRVHMIHSPYDPWTPSHLVLDLSGLGVVQVKMVPTIPFRHPENFTHFVQVMCELFVGIVDEGVALLGD